MKEKIKEIMAGILNVSVKDISENFGPEDAANWDSLNNLMLISSLESEFKIQFSMAEIQGMNTFSSIESTINSKL